jgi:hypothetical protein
MVDEGPHPICFYKNLFDSLHSQWLFLTAPPIHSGWISSSSNPIPPRAVYCQWPFLQAHPRWMKVLIQSGPPRAFMVHCVSNGNFMPIQCPKSLFGSLCSQWPFLTLNSRFSWVDFQKAPINKIYICHIYLESKKIYSKVGLPCWFALPVLIIKWF